MLVNKDDHLAGAKSFMWVYRTGRIYTGRQIILYEYQKTRNASHPREFLKGFSGICVTDGYQVYHTIEDEREDLRIVGCWSHSRRRFDEKVKALPEAKHKDSRAYLFFVNHYKFVLWVGNKRLTKRRLFNQYIGKEYSS